MGRLPAAVASEPLNQLILRDGLQPQDVLFVIHGVEVGDATLDARTVVQLAPNHHLVVRPRGFVFLVEATEGGGLAVAPELRLPTLRRKRLMHPAKTGRVRSAPARPLGFNDLQCGAVQFKMLGNRSVVCVNMGLHDLQHQQQQHQQQRQQQRQQKQQRQLFRTRRKAQAKNIASGKQRTPCRAHASKPSRPPPWIITLGAVGTL